MRISEFPVGVFLFNLEFPHSPKAWWFLLLEGTGSYETKYQSCESTSLICRLQPSKQTAFFYRSAHQDNINEQVID